MKLAPLTRFGLMLAGSIVLASVVPGWAENTSRTVNLNALRSLSVQQQSPATQQTAPAKIPVARTEMYAQVTTKPTATATVKPIQVQSVRQVAPVKATPSKAEVAAQNAKPVSTQVSAAPVKSGAQITVNPSNIPDQASMMQQMLARINQLEKESKAQAKVIDNLMKQNAAYENRLKPIEYTLNSPNPNTVKSSLVELKLKAIGEENNIGQLQNQLSQTSEQIKLASEEFKHHTHSLKIGGADGTNYKDYLDTPNSHMLFLYKPYVPGDKINLTTGEPLN